MNIQHFDSGECSGIFRLDNINLTSTSFSFFLRLYQKKKFLYIFFCSEVFFSPFYLLSFVRGRNRFLRFHAYFFHLRTSFLKSVMLLTCVWTSKSGHISLLCLKSFKLRRGSRGWIYKYTIFPTEKNKNVTQLTDHFYFFSLGVKTAFPVFNILKRLSHGSE